MAKRPSKPSAKPEPKPAPKRVLRPAPGRIEKRGGGWTKPVIPPSIGTRPAGVPPKKEA
jgi:hypothetical protein